MNSLSKAMQNMWARWLLAVKIFKTLDPSRIEPSDELGKTLRPRVAFIKPSYSVEMFSIKFLRFDSKNLSASLYLPVENRKFDSEIHQRKFTKSQNLLLIEGLSWVHPSFLSDLNLFSTPSGG